MIALTSEAQRILLGKKALTKESFDESVHAKIFISWQTNKWLQISVYSLIGLVQFLLRNGANDKLSNTFCQDPVEEHFGCQRALGHRCDSPNIADFGYNENQLQIQKYLSPKALAK